MQIVITHGEKKQCGLGVQREVSKGAGEILFLGVLVKMICLLCEFIGLYIYELYTFLLMLNFIIINKNV